MIIKDVNGDYYVKVNGYTKGNGTNVEDYIRSLPHVEALRRIRMGEELHIVNEDLSEKTNRVNVLKWFILFMFGSIGLAFTLFRKKKYNN